MNNKTNHRIVVSRRGGPEVLLTVVEDRPEPGPGEVRLAVQAAGVSAYDLMIRSGWIPGNPRPPFTPGEDVVGVVDKLGPGVTTFEPGQRVAAWTYGRGGGYAESICLPGEHLVPVPSGLDSAEAVCLVVNYLTAHLYLHHTAAMQRGDQILVHGAAGGLGTALLQLGAVAGLEMYGTASARNHDLVASLGAKPIDYHNEDFVERIRSFTGDGVDAVFDVVGGPRQLWRSYRALRRDGRLIPMGSVATQKAGMRSIPLGLLVVGLLKLVPDGKQVRFSPNMMKFPHEHPDWYRETLSEILDLADQGRIEPVVAGRFPLSDAARAHALLERGGHTGKVVLIADA